MIYTMLFQTNTVKNKYNETSSMLLNSDKLNLFGDATVFVGQFLIKDCRKITL